MNKIFIGIVNNGKFNLLYPRPTPEIHEMRFTRIQAMEAKPPETGEIILGEYEGKAIAVQGNNQGGWVYSAEVIDKGGPLVTTLVRSVFGSMPDMGKIKR
jgi:hypothetical protein